MPDTQDSYEYVYIQAHGQECSHALIRLPCRNAHKLFSWVTRNHRFRESMKSLLWKYPSILFLTWNTPVFSWTCHSPTPSLTTLFMFPPVQTYIMSGKTPSLPSTSLHQFVLPAPFFHPEIPLCSELQHTTPPSPLPSVWTHLASGNKQRRVCVRGGRDGVSLSEGTMLLLVALHLKLLLSLSVCVCDKQFLVEFH